MKRIAVLMAVHNRREKTLRCLECLYSNTVPEGYELEIYMTNDGCTDGTPEIVKERFANVHILKGNGNLYWNRGMWTAWNEASKDDFDHFLWLNDDTFLYSNALKMMLGLSLKEANAIIVGATENLEKTEITYGGYVEGVRQKPLGRPIEVEYFNGNVVLIPRNVFQKLGNLDYYFRHSKGDFDYGMRAYKAGIKMFQTGNYVGVCEHDTKSNGWDDPSLPLFKRLTALTKPNGMPPREIFYINRKHRGVFSGVLYSCSVVLRCLFPKLLS